jgi:hypothetical protein
VNFGGIQATIFPDARFHHALATMVVYLQALNSDLEDRFSSIVATHFDSRPSDVGT